MTGNSDAHTSLPQLATKVPGLDVVLNGGLLRGGVYLLMGSPGAGKTILSNQICFRHAEDGGRALYVTLLAESHNRMLAHIEHMDFYDPSAVARSVFFISGYQALETKNLDGLLELLRHEVRNRQATLLVIDGMVIAGAVAESELALKKFVHELKAFMEMTACTCLILTSADASALHYPARTMVDGLIELRFWRGEMRTARELEVAKLRGSGQLLGRHVFEISDAGVIVHPRFEARYGRTADMLENRERLSLGVRELDVMTGGGLLSGSVTLLLGPPGSGKTLLGLQFLHAGAEADEPGLYFGFFEPPPRLVGKAEGVGMRFGEHVLDHRIELEWVPPLEQHADALAERLLDIVRRRGIKRVVFDGLGGLAQTMRYSDRLDPLFTALSNELRAHDATTLATEESGLWLGESLELPHGRLSASVENIIVLRYAERDHTLRRYLSILKMREGEYDASLREFTISKRGLALAGRERTAPAKARRERRARRGEVRRDRRK